MLDKAEINVGRLLLWLGMAAGVALLFANFFIHTEGIGALGLGFLVVTSAHAVRRVIVARDDALREAFECGKNYERMHSVH